MSNEGSSPDGIIVESGAVYDVRTGKRHVFRIAEPHMTISFLLDSADHVDVEYPKFVLQSSDGAYDKELCPRDDLVPGDDYLQLRFENLLPRKRYTLTTLHDKDYKEVVFRSAPFGEIVDQRRDNDDCLEDHSYAEIELDDSTELSVEDWNKQDSDASPE